MIAEKFFYLQKGSVATVCLIADETAKAMKSPLLKKLTLTEALKHYKNKKIFFTIRAEIAIKEEINKVKK